MGLLDLAVKSVVGNAVKNAQAAARKNLDKQKGTGSSGGGVTVSKPVSTGGSGSGVVQGTNWQGLIDDAVSRGDMTSAALYEQQRNKKIKDPSYKGSQTTTNLYSQYLPQNQPEMPSFDEYLKQSGFDDYSAQTQAAIQASVNNAINGYREQMDTTNQQSDELARQAYLTKRLAERNLGQQLSASGLAGGMADSQRIGLESTYQNQLTDIEQQRADTIKALESSITEAKLAGDMQAANELSAMLQQIQGQWNSYVQNQQQMNRQDLWNQQQMDQQNLWNQQQMDQQNYWKEQQMAAEKTENAYARALNLINSGFLPDDATLAAAGISKLEAQSRLNQIRAQLGRTPTANSPVRRPQGSGYDNGGLSTDQVKQMQRALGVTADGLWGSESQRAANGLTADQAWAQLNGSRFSALGYRTLLERGDFEGADAYLRQYWPNMSSSDRIRAQLVAREFGG